MKNTEITTLRTLKQLGISPDLTGYAYVAAAIGMAIEDETLVHGSVTKVLYPEIAKKFYTTASRVEKSIRHAVEIASYRGSEEVTDEIFGHTISAMSGKPTNGQFIACVAEYVKLCEQGAVRNA